MKEKTLRIIEHSKDVLQEFKGIAPTPEICASKLNSIMLLQVLENQIILNDKLDAIQKSLILIERNVI